MRRLRLRQRRAPSGGCPSPRAAWLLRLTKVQTGDGKAARDRGTEYRAVSCVSSPVTQRPHQTTSQSLHYARCMDPGAEKQVACSAIVSGDFWGSQEGCQGPFRPSGRNLRFLLRFHQLFCLFLAQDRTLHSVICLLSRLQYPGRGGGRGPRGAIPILLLGLPPCQASGRAGGLSRV